ncbi:hypothetical protein GCM10028820_29550 [Tessaracoccus terricola]
MDLVIRRARPDEWQQARRLRLEMLGDAPEAFSDRLAEAQLWDDDRWRARLTSAVWEDSVLVVAVGPDGNWRGQMGAREYLSHEPARIWLLEVFVSPGFRSHGVAEQLLAAVEDWVRGRGHERLFLDVHEHATAARRFYARSGFSETGGTQPYPNNPAQRELEMVKDLSRIGGTLGDRPGSAQGDAQCCCGAPKGTMDA